MSKREQLEVRKWNFNKINTIAIKIKSTYGEKSHKWYVRFLCRNSQKLVDKENMFLKKKTQNFKDYRF